MSKVKSIGFIGFLWIAILGTLLHFTYEWSGENSFVGLFSAVNESIWEHAKLLFFPAAVFALLLYPFVRKKYPAFLTAFAAAALCAMFLQTALYYTYSGIWGKDVPFLNIVLFYVCAALNAALGMYWSKRWQNTGSLWGVALIAAVSICFFRFTVNPPDIGIFAIP